jgi:site-specific DNA-methyltransferase (adenine-specific)
VDLPLNTIHQGDCLDSLQRLPTGVIDLAFADPPFNIGYQYDVYDDNRDYRAYLDWTQAWMAEVSRVLKPHGTFWVAIGDEYAAEIKLLAQNELRLVCRSWVIWYYTFGVNCTKKFSRSHAHLFYFVKDARHFTFNDTEIRVPSARQLVYADARANPNGRLPDDTWILRPQDLHNGFTPDDDTWYFPRVAGTFKERAGFHGCQMPEQLLGRIVRLCSTPGDTVLDPFAGSGTTLAVAKKLGRNWIGFELSEHYAKQASSRVAAVEAGHALEGSAQPLVSAPRTPTHSPAEPEPPPAAQRKSASKATPRQYAPRPYIPQPDAEGVAGLLQAFRASGGGYSADRVIADPELNGRFLELCLKSGVPGCPIELNRSLLRLRKAGQLAGLHRSRRTNFPKEELDCYLFASEIAMRRVMDEAAVSLDDVLCDPDLARRFDEIARCFAPGFSSLHYRWGALRLRKRTHDVRELSRTLPPELLQRRFRPFRPLSEAAADGLEDIPGVYLIRGRAARRLYAGETLDLARRVRHQCTTAEEWRKVSDALEVGVIPLGGIDTGERQGLRAHLIGKYTPDLNLLVLGVA